jgi:hypothetical protein
MENEKVMELANRIVGLMRHMQGGVDSWWVPETTLRDAASDAGIEFDDGSFPEVIDWLTVNKYVMLRRRAQDEFMLVWVPVTNEQGLPAPLVRAVSTDSYVRRGDISVTEMLQPPMIRALRRRFGHLLQEDVSNLIWAFFGSMAHRVAELHAKEGNMLEEQRLSVEIDGWQVTGTADLLDYESLDADGLPTLVDYKTTSVWSVIFNSRTVDWGLQLNLYALLYTMSGFAVGERQNVLFLRDWNENDRRRRAYGNYPPSSVHVIRHPRMEPEAMLQYATERIRLHREQESKPVSEIPVCTPEERWARGGSWKVFRNTNKTALRVFDSEAEAQNLIEFCEQKDREEKKKHVYRIEHFPGRNVRCESYCEVARFCPFGRKVLELA